MENQPNTICPSCKFQIPVSAYFCPNCGTQLHYKPVPITLAKKIWVYFVSLFLPPFGLWYAWKYLKNGEYESKKLGIIAIILTIISTLFTIWLAGGFITSVYQALSTINNLGY